MKSDTHLQEYDGELSFATDAWTSPNHKAIVAFMVHLQHKGVPLRMVLDVVEVADSHSGVNLAAAFAKMVDDFKIAIKMLGITTDNASPNDVMIDEPAKLIESFQGQANRARCFDHIINLVAKSLLHQFDVPQNGADAALDDAENALCELAKDLELGVREGGEEGEPPDDIEGLQDEREGMSVEDRTALDASVQPVKLVLVKLRKIASAIIHSSTKLLPAWLKVLADLELAERKMPRNVVTRWNSTFRMLEFALEYRLAVDEMTGDRAMELRRYEMDDNEWEIAKQLCDVLKVFNDATLYFSCDTPSLPMVIPAMDIIDEKLTNDSLDSDYEPCIRAALGMAKKTLNRYYNKTDPSNVYRIAMVLHPSHKLQYFRNAGWQVEWITTARALVCEEYDRAYAQCAVNVEPTQMKQSECTPSSNMFDNLLNTNVSKGEDNRDELECYLDADTERVDSDTLGWWYARCKEFPHLSRMAMSYLTIPATSVDVERIFNKGRILLPHLRNGLSAESIRALLCLAEWSRLGFVHDTDVLAVVSLPEAQEDDDGLEDGWDNILWD
ncbi:putative AC9 transposase [Sparassis crispa]|uniref:Putative AC9 transposase n=1 Tax=Sparassis crispa TaxID=139825 RepID=A0A401GJE0_9APHY|nr:putative AC9 transposase [Sparassis crispa]GBE82272.1 putative AC9 transposase [Sparassis crispa]